MKTQEPLAEQMFPPEPAHPQNRSWLATVGAILVVILVVGGSAIVFAQLSQHHKNQAQAPVPPSSKWVQVLNGYSLASLEAADSPPSTLYACAIHAQPGPAVSNQSAPGSDSFTVLRSTDFGAHWQDVGTKANIGRSCELAINPTNSNDLYALGISSADQVSSILKHSTNGGQTWTTIQPTIKLPGSSSAPAWNLQQLSVVSNALFGIQSLPQRVNPVA